MLQAAAKRKAEAAELEAAGANIFEKVRQATGGFKSGLTQDMTWLYKTAHPEVCMLLLSLVSLPST